MTPEESGTRIIRDRSHHDHIERWAKFVRENPDRWKKIHTQFIDAQFEKSYEFYRRLAQTKEGRQKIIKIFGIKNLDGYPSLKD